MSPCGNVQQRNTNTAVIGRELFSWKKMMACRTPPSYLLYGECITLRFACTVITAILITPSCKLYGISPTHWS